MKTQNDISIRKLKVRIHRTFDQITQMSHQNVYVLTSAYPDHRNHNETATRHRKSVHLKIKMIFLCVCVCVRCKFRVTVVCVVPLCYLKTFSILHINGIVVSTTFCCSIFRHFITSVYGNGISE